MNGKSKGKGNPTLGGMENKPGQTENPYDGANRPEPPVDRSGKPERTPTPRETPTPGGKNK